MTLNRRLLPYALLAPGIIWLVVFFVLPVGYMGRLSLMTGILPNFEFNWAFENFGTAFSSYSEQFLRSLWFAGAATALCLLIGYPLAYAIALKGGKYRNAMLFAVIAPFFTTYLIRTLAWKTIFDDSSPLVSFLKTIGILGSDGRVLATSAAVIAGLTYNFLPFMILPIFARLDRMDVRLIEAANDLYSSAWTAFRKVTLPLSAPGIVAGTLLTFIPAIGDYVNVIFLGGTQQTMIGNVIQAQFLVVRDYPIAATLSFILMAVILVVVLIYIRIAGSEALMEEEAA